jgi:hypothetical protein
MLEAGIDVDNAIEELGLKYPLPFTRQYVISEYIKLQRAELARARETIEIVATQRDRALEAVDKLREALKFYSDRAWNDDYPGGISYKIDGSDGVYLDTGQKAKEAIAATEPATVDLPKCDHCGAIACGTDCDGSSHYTPGKKE